MAVKKCRPENHSTGRDLFSYPRPGVRVAGALGPRHQHLASTRDVLCGVQVVVPVTHADAFPSVRERAPPTVPEQQLDERSQGQAAVDRDRQNIGAC